MSRAGSQGPMLRGRSDARWARAGRARVAKLDNFRFERLDLIKIDSEGQEMGVLGGASLWLPPMSWKLKCPVPTWAARASLTDLVG